jgi:hypothetical protein
MLQLVENGPQSIAGRWMRTSMSLTLSRPVDFHGHRIVMPMQPLADIAGKRNKVRRTENVVLFFQADVIVLRHKFVA